MIVAYQVESMGGSCLELFCNLDITFAEQITSDLTPADVGSLRVEVSKMVALALVRPLWTSRFSFRMPPEFAIAQLQMWCKIL